MLETNTLTVHELYVYELVKFFSRSILKMHAESFLNNLFSFEKTSIYSTRRSTKNYLSVPMTKNKLQRCSIKYRGSKLYNLLHENCIIDGEDLTYQNFSSTVHRIKDNYILGNQELSREVFGL